TAGQLGDDLFERRTMRSVFADAIVKYKGWAAMMAYMSRTTSENAITVNPEDAVDIRYVFAGEGFDYQLSYVFKNNYEIIGRYSIQHVDDDIRLLAPNTKEFTLGVTKYIWEHTFKLQAELTYDQLEFADGSGRDNWY